MSMEYLILIAILLFNEESPAITRGFPLLFYEFRDRASSRHQLRCRLGTMFLDPREPFAHILKITVTIKTYKVIPMRFNLRDVS